MPTAAEFLGHLAHPPFDLFRGTVDGLLFPGPPIHPVKADRGLPLAIAPAHGMDPEPTAIRANQSCSGFEAHMASTIRLMVLNSSRVPAPRAQRAPWTQPKHRWARSPFISPDSIRLSKSSSLCAVTASHAGGKAFKLCRLGICPRVEWAAAFTFISGTPRRPAPADLVPRWAPVQCESSF
jgi:hypothetical protein